MLLAFAIAGPALASGWPTGGHDTRRTGQSDVSGPQDIAWVHDRVVSEVTVFNAPPAVTDDGQMVWGTWGVVQSTEASSDPRTWDKLDGTVLSLDSHLDTTWDASPALDVNPFCYDYDGRTDLTWCPDGGQVSYHNGIVDGTPTLTGDGAAWVARGDGRLYEVDLADGTAERVLTTWNPEDLDDPDGGGGLLASPLALPDGGVLVASVAAGPYETNAVYAVGRGGGVRWRLPTDSAGFDTPFWAAAALSPDGGTAYVAGWAWPGFNDADEDLALDGLVMALDLGVDDDADDSDRIAWQAVPMSGDGEPLYVRTLSVGADGTLYLGGLAGEPERPWVMALDANGDPLWTAALDPSDTEVVRGLALHEDGGATVRVLVTTGQRASQEREGRLHALDPTSGAVIWTFDPEENGGRGAPSGIAIDADGTAWFSTHGAERKGSVFAVDADGQELWHACSEEYEGAHPILTGAGDVVVGEADWLECALTAPLSNTCRPRATERAVRIWYADPDTAPGDARIAWQCCRCATGGGPATVLPWLASLLLVRRRRLR